MKCKTAHAAEIFVIRHGKVVVPVAEHEGDAAAIRDVQRRLSHIMVLPKDGQLRFDPNSAFPPGTKAPTVDLAQWIRFHCESHVTAKVARILFDKLKGKQLSLSQSTIPSAMNATDRRIIVALAERAPLGAILRSAEVPHSRLLAFIFFARQCGILKITDDRRAATKSPPPRPELSSIEPTAKPATVKLNDAEKAAMRPVLPIDPHRLLGVPKNAAQDTVRRAYRRRARHFHPDMHPYASARQRRELEARLRAVTEAYEQLAAQ